MAVVQAGHETSLEAGDVGREGIEGADFPFTLAADVKDNHAYQYWEKYLRSTGLRAIDVHWLGSAVSLVGVWLAIRVLLWLLMVLLLTVTVVHLDLGHWLILFLHVCG